MQTSSPSRPHPAVLPACAGRSWLLVAGLLAGSAALADGAPVLRPVEFNLQTQALFLGEAGSVGSNGFLASGSLGGSGPRVEVRGSGTSSVDSRQNEASATALWQFYLGGPIGVEVPILINGRYGAERLDSVGASGGLSLGLDPFRLTYVMTFRCIDGDSSGCASSQDFELHQTVLSGITTFIGIATGGALRGRGVAGFESFSSFIDPLVSIDPAFARLSEFTLSVSPGAGGFAAAVPEPQTCALLLAGLAVVGSVARRRGRRS